MLARLRPDKPSRRLEKRAAQTSPGRRSEFVLGIRSSPHLFARSGYWGEI
jgi:hypothetical protein